jgi:thiol-disulfide isomerase/thioredoxin/mono/diheme cytochrome c family protein
MPRRRVAVLLLAGAVAVPFGWSADPGTPGPARVIEGFRLSDPRDGKAVALGDFKDRKAVVVVFLGTECPVNNAFLPVLAKLHEEYGPKGVAFVGVNANRQDDPGRVAAHARANKIPFPVAKDPDNSVADRFGARRTPEAFVLDPGGRVLYRGRVDDQFGVGYSRPGKPTLRDLALALDEVLSGKPVSVAATPVAGCLIARRTPPKKGGAVTYAMQVSRVLQKHCQECHRPGQAAPMPLLTYDDALPWAETIREVVAEKRMPPWSADPRYGHWRNDRSLGEADRETLLAWVDGGCPRGDDSDLPPPRKFAGGWRIGEPDAVFTMPKAFDVPAEAPRGGVPYQYFSVATHFKEDRWVVRAEARPGNPAVVHHVLVYLSSASEPFDLEGPGNILCGTAPGDSPLVLPPGCAKKIPAGARIVFQMHYTTNGTACTDRSSVGLVFAKEPPRHRVLTKPVYPEGFITRQDAIPAGAPNYRIESEFTFPENAHVLALMPHMHLRGKDFTFEVTRPGGKPEMLLSVPHYNFNWQVGYDCAEPLALPRGTRLHCVAHFDNSAKNPSNPDPTKTVYWGDQTWEEMMIGWVDYYLDARAP